MTALTLQPKLLQQLEQVAAENTTSPDELLDAAVRTYLRQLDREKIRLEATAYRNLHSQLLLDYLGQYVAIHRGRVVDSDGNFEAIHVRVRARFGNQAILIRQVETAPERELTFRSPRIESKVRA
ncbi:MAG: hypothetical protein ACOYNY_40770 [Caldilineaceae bacterium]